MNTSQCNNVNSTAESKAELRHKRNRKRKLREKLRKQKYKEQKKIEAENLIHSLNQQSSLEIKNCSSIKKTDNSLVTQCNNVNSIAESKAEHRHKRNRKRKLREKLRKQKYKEQKKIEEENLIHTLNQQSSLEIKNCSSITKTDNQLVTDKQVMKNIAESIISNQMSLDGKDELTAFENNQLSLEKINSPFCDKNHDKLYPEEIILKRKKIS